MTAGCSTFEPEWVIHTAAVLQWFRWLLAFGGVKSTVQDAWLLFLPLVVSVALGVFGSRVCVF
jgi:hypothetical protein